MLFLCTKGTARGAALFFISSLFLTACGRQEEALGAPAVTTVSAAPSNKDMAEIGKLAFFDPSLSASGKQSCASCTAQ
jgi:cytochrome c peroxidase